jgi:putative heme-binding domain-containing protein
MKIRIVIVLMALTTIAAGITDAQTHHHDHGGADVDTKPLQRPKVYLDKSSLVVWYQLNRLDNERLLLVERKTDDAKYALVYTAILTRAGMSPQYREEALAGLIELNKTDAATEVLAALETIDADDRQQQRTGRQLTRMLLSQPMAVLLAKVGALKTATESDNRMLRAASHAGLIVAGDLEAAWQRASATSAGKLDYLAAVSLIPKPDHRSQLRQSIVGLLDASQEADVRRAAITTLTHVPTGQAESFELIAPFVTDQAYRVAAIRTMLKIPSKYRSDGTSAKLVDALVERAELTPAAERTSDEFVDAMQLADQLLAKLSVEAARAYRNRLREVTVRVVRIHTVEEEMRYDTPYFAVEAGRPVQIVLVNEDLMPHNLVITVNGALKEVAQEGMLLGPAPGFEGKPYVPQSDKVLFATGMVQSRQQVRLTFTAPSEPGEYPFVCTFPRHWMRMYGVMVVVPDLDAWQRNPTKPADPIGSNREFVKSWSLDDFKDNLETGLRGRSAKIGQRLFAEATCAQCHKIKGQGGAVGPELTDVLKRWKGDRLAILREILEPSHRIDPKYAVQVIVTDKGRVITGIVQAEDATSVFVLVNPESPVPVVIKRAEIDEIVKTSISMMPKALLDRFTTDEIFEILSYVEHAGEPARE